VTAARRRRGLLDRGKPPKPALWNNPCVRPLGLDPVPVALRVPGDLAPFRSCLRTRHPADARPRPKLRRAQIAPQRLRPRGTHHHADTGLRMRLRVRFEAVRCGALRLKAEARSAALSRSADADSEDGALSPMCSPR